MILVCMITHGYAGDPIGRLKTHTKPGVIILFHCCKRHQGETRQLLPIYLKWLVDNGYTSKVID